MVMGGDPEHPEELGAEIEVFLGPDMERHIIDKSCVIFIPPYFMHCPWRILRTTKPWIFMEVNQGPRHTEKTYKQLVPREALGETTKRRTSSRTKVSTPWCRGLRLGRPSDKDLAGSGRGRREE